MVQPGKGNGVVILDKTDYIQKISELINNERKFKRFDEDPNMERGKSLLKLINGGFLKMK